MEHGICHNEYRCHSLGEARQNLINAIQVMLNKADDRPCFVEDTKRKVPPLMKYPGYVNSRHPGMLPEGGVPPNMTFICHRECHKDDYCVGGAGFVDDDPSLPNMDNSYKRKSDYGHRRNNAGENACTKYEMNSPGSHFRVRNQSTELRGGVLYNCCGCMKRNGLQDQCPRTDCMGAPPKCTSYNPGPCCRPAQARRKYEIF